MTRRRKKAPKSHNIRRGRIKPNDMIRIATRQRTLLQHTPCKGFENVAASPCFGLKNANTRCDWQKMLNRVLPLCLASPRKYVDQNILIDLEIPCVRSNFLKSPRKKAATAFLSPINVCFRLSSRFRIGRGSWEESRVKTLSVDRLASWERVSQRHE